MNRSSYNATLQSFDIVTLWFCQRFTKLQAEGYYVAAGSPEVAGGRLCLCLTLTSLFLQLILTC